MLKRLVFTTLLAASTLADGGQSSYSSYQNQKSPSYGFSYGNAFHATPAEPYISYLDSGVDWALAFATAFIVVVALLLVGGAFLLAATYASYYEDDIDTGILIRSFGELPVPQIGQIISGIEKLQELYGTATSTASA